MKNKALALACLFAVSVAASHHIFDDEPFDPIDVVNGSAGWFPSIYGEDDELGALNEAQLNELAEFGPVKPVKNHRGIVIGESRPVFQLRNHE